MAWSALKRGIARALGPDLCGRLDYFRFPGLRGEALNAQPARAALFEQILARFSPHFVVETGTHRGATTAWLAERVAPRPVFSVELDVRHLGFAHMALRRHRNVHLTPGDSRALLGRLLADDRYRHGRGFFYLDAHWNDDLPLAGELEIVLARAASAVVAIDDFAVPGDAGYGFDDYGPGRRLEEALLRPVLDRFECTVAYPSTASAREGGARRGCCVIGRGDRARQLLAALPGLRP